MANDGHQHGVQGVYYGGDWLPIEECDRFLAKSEDCKNDCSVCPRSSSKRSSLKSSLVQNTYDVVIIGAGCIGGAIARELSKSKLSVLVVEAADDVAQGATKGNSGIVHAGYDDEPGSVRARLCWKGNQMFPQLDRELRFGFQRNGSLVLARNKEEEEELHSLKAKGEANGVQRLEIIDRDTILRLEPHVNPDVTSALLAPDAGNIIPYEYTIALLENAVDNGVELRIRREVSAIETIQDLSSSIGADSSASASGNKIGEGNVSGSDNTAPVFKVTLRHWEPNNYVAAMRKQQQLEQPPTEVKSTLGEIFLFAGLLVALTGAAIYSAPLLANRLEKPLHVVLLGSAVGVVVVAFTLLKMMFPSVSNKKMGRGSVATGGPGGSNFEDLVTSARAPAGSGGSDVTVDEMRVGGSGSAHVMGGVTVEKEEVRARYIVNCAGSGADTIAAMIGDTSFTIKPRLGDYLLLNRNQGSLTKHTIFPCPDPVLGKGVLVQTTLWGNLILGPTARDVHSPDFATTSKEDIQTYILSKCKQLVAGFDVNQVFHSFCGSRAKSSRGDWIIEPSARHPHFILAAGIDSPGLAGSPAIALEVVELLRNAGLEMPANPSFNPNRRPIITPKSGWKGLKAGPVGKYADAHPEENVICKCEKVTEAEVLTALRGPLPIDSTQAIRKRTRAGMGHCQGDTANYNCEARVAAIIARELKIPIEAVGRRPWPATSCLPQRWLSDEDKAKLSSAAAQ